MRRIKPRDIDKMMRSMGIHVESVEATEVLIKLSSGDSIVIRDPQVSLMRVGGEEVYQVMGRSERVGSSAIEHPYSPSEDDISLVASQAGVDFETARRALIETRGDLAEAIVRLKEGRS